MANPLQLPRVVLRTPAALVALYTSGVHEGPVIERGLDYLMQYVPGGAAFVLLTTLALVAFVEDIGTFNRGIGPFYSLALMIGGLWTLARRSLETRASPVHHSDWFWAALGLAMYGASTALASPIAGYLIANGRTDLVIVAWKIRAVLVIVSFSFVAWGIYRGPMVSKFSTAP